MPIENALAVTGLQGPRRYIQGPWVLSHAELYLAALGTRWWILADERVRPLLQHALTVSAGPAAGWPRWAHFNGEASWVEIRRLETIAAADDPDVIVAAGGGKALDTGKLLAQQRHLPLIVIPTIASTDAPTSSVAVLYTEEHRFDEAVPLRKNPDLVLVDTSLIASAPIRFLIAGMGDALSKRIEVEACLRSHAPNMHGWHPPHVALAMARLAYDLIHAHGLAAREAVVRQQPDVHLEAVVESIILLSGLAFENGGLAAAHAIYDGFTVLPGAHAALHGEIVAFGTLAQLMMEQRPSADVEEYARLCISLGLPVTIAQIVTGSVTTADLQAVAEAACQPDKTMHNMPFAVGPALVVDALQAADHAGQTLRRTYTANEGIR